MFTLPNLAALRPPDAIGPALGSIEALDEPGQGSPSGLFAPSVFGLIFGGIAEVEPGGVQPEVSPPQDAAIASLPVHFTVMEPTDEGGRSVKDPYTVEGGKAAKLASAVEADVPATALIQRRTGHPPRSDSVTGDASLISNLKNARGDVPEDKNETASTSFRTVEPGASSLRGNADLAYRGRPEVEGPARIELSPPAFQRESSAASVPAAAQSENPSSVLFAYEPLRIEKPALLFAVATQVFAIEQTRSQAIDTVALKNNSLTQSAVGEVGWEAASAQERPITATVVRHPSGVLQIRMEPGDFGRMSIEFEDAEGEPLRAIVSVERAESLDIARRHADALARELERHGFASVDLKFRSGGRDEFAKSSEYDAGYSLSPDPAIDDYCTAPVYSSQAGVLDVLV